MATPAPGRDEGALIGRRPERDALESLVLAAERGAGACVAIVGEAGMGKTRLAEHARRLADAHSIPMRAVSCRATQIDVPFGAFRDLLGPATWPTAAGPRGILEAGAAGHQEWATADLLASEVASMAVAGPGIVVLEDLHLADPATLRAVDLLVGRAGSVGLGLVLTSRPPRTGSYLHELLRVWADGGTPVLTLSPLDDREVAELVASTSPSARGRADRMLTAAAGNPLLVLATVEAMSSGASAAPGAGAGSIVTKLVAALPDGVLRTVQAAAVLGPALTVELIARVRARPSLEVIADLDLAVTAGVFTRADDGYGFRHELFREAAFASLTADGRRALHREVAALLMARRGHELDIADHLLLGAPRGDDDAIRWLRDAALGQCRANPGTALAMIDAAIRLSVEPDHALLVARLEALAGSGRSAEAVELGRSLVHDVTDPQQRARMLRDLALACFVQGDATGAEREMSCAVELLAGRKGQDRAMAEQAFARLLALDLKGAGELATRAARASDDAHAVVAARAVLTVQGVFEARFTDAATHADTMLAHAERPTATEAHQYQPWFCAALLAAEVDDLPGLERLARRGQDEARRTGSLWAVPAYDAVTAFAALRSGHLSDAAAHARAVIGGHDARDSFGIVAWCHAIVAQVCLAQGDAEAARRHTIRGETLAQVHGTGFGLDHLAMCRSYLEEMDGAGRVATVVLTAIWDSFTELGVLCPRQWIGPRLVRLSSAAGDNDRAAAVVAALDTTADATGLVSMRADALVARSWLEGTPTAALAAAELLSDAPRRFARAEALAAAAMLCLRRGQRGAGRGAALAAAEDFDAVGATALGDAARRLAPGSSLKPRPRFGPAALTRSERTVVALVGEGLTNEAIALRLHLSRRTVESHVSAAYRKLGVGNRVELTVALRATPDAETA
jgi:DNA-binding CsgD family transcriptional regulator